LSAVRLLWNPEALGQKVRREVAAVSINTPECLISAILITATGSPKPARRVRRTGAAGSANRENADILAGGVGCAGPNHVISMTLPLMLPCTNRRTGMRQPY
jgi:hypothetical protein